MTKSTDPTSIVTSSETKSRTLYIGYKSRTSSAKAIALAVWTPDGAFDGFQESNVTAKDEAHLMTDEVLLIAGRRRTYHYPSVMNGEFGNRTAHPRYHSTAHPDLY